MIANALSFKGTRTYVYAGVLVGLGILVDVPNLFMMAPSVILIMNKSVQYLRTRSTAKVRISLKPLAMILGVFPLVILFAYYNFSTTGSPTKLAQFIGRTETIKEASASINTVTANEDGGIDLPFDSRLILNGLYILVVSNERGVLYYSPILILGVIGLALALKKDETSQASVLSIATLGVILITYAMFGDPWGGWSFGARYMIPFNAILSIFISIAIGKYARKPLFVALFSSIILYSLYINTIGALTTSSVPPKGEAQNLPVTVPYTYEYNLKLVEENKSSSYIYNTQFKDKISLNQFMYMLVGLEITVFMGFYYLCINKKWK
jgi:hypothetical protein